MVSKFLQKPPMWRQTRRQEVKACDHLCRGEGQAARVSSSSLIRSGVSANSVWTTINNEAALVGGLFAISNHRRDGSYWHIADIPITPAFVRYWGNSGQRWILACGGLSANDPTATLAVHCGK